MRQHAYREARRRFVSRESAEDIAQVTAARYATRFRFVERIPAWVRRVVENLVHRRNAKRAERQVAETLFGEPAAQLPDEVERRQLHGAILARLPERDRKLLELALAGRSHAEIGHELGLPTNAVGANLARVIERAGRVRSALSPSATEKNSRSR